MSLELSRNILIGQYIPGDTLIHRLDPRAKILCTLALLFAVSFTRSLTAALIYLLVILALVRLSRIPVGFVLRPFIRGLPVILFFLSFSVLYLSWFQPDGVLLIDWGFIRVTSNALLQAALSLVRLMSILLLVSLPTLTTKITELTHGVELLLQPGARIGLPVHELALVITIALRFVPILTEELERVIKAQASRGGEVGALSWRQPKQIAQSLLPLVVPLFVNAFRRAEELAVAMEARCYLGGRGRTKFIQLHGSWVDVAITLVVLVFVVGVWYATSGRML
jgi:energy-coupling factor transport system permease protein